MNRNDKLTISYGLLVDTADAIRTQLGTSELISPEDFPTLIASISPTPPTPVRPVVPQTGTWQFKTTHPKGFVIIGSDDDTRDVARFTRFVTGYGYPVVINSTHYGWESVVDSDSDTEDSTYPSGSVAQFPNGGTIGDVDLWILANNKGEIALHGGDSNKLWDSDLLTGDVLDTYFATYEAGGGTKTKTELKEAMMDKYKHCDVSQGAPVVAIQREELEADLDDWVYTIGDWGGGFNFVIDEINCGGTNPVACGSQKIARPQNYMGSGILTWNPTTPYQSPYWISRQSGGLISANTETWLERAYNYRCCIELFKHYWLDGTKARWDDFKDAMDTIKSWVDQGKIEVVTRKQYYELGEFVEHPIIGLSLQADAVAYAVGSTITASNFTCKAILDNNTEVVCEADKILDISNIDTSAEGTYTATLEYRGFKTTTNVMVLQNVPSEFIIQNASFSGESMERNNDYCDLDPSLAYEAGKTYKIRFKFRANTTVQYSSHWISFNVATPEVGWRTSTAFQFDTSADVTEAIVTLNVEVTSARTLNKLIRAIGLQNTTVGAWTISECYVWEVPT